MRAKNLKLSPAIRSWLHGTFGLLFVTGLGWWLLQRYVRVETEFGLQAHPLAPGLMKLHGAGAMLALLVLGALLPLHVQRGWQSLRNRGTGIGMLLLCGGLILTGYALYYVGGEKLRTWSATIHLVLGLGFPLFLIWHIARGRRSAKPDSCPRPR